MDFLLFWVGAWACIGLFCLTTYVWNCYVECKRWERLCSEYRSAHARARRAAKRAQRAKLAMHASEVK